MKNFIVRSSWSRKTIGAFFIAAVACMVACDDSSSASADANDESISVESSSSSKSSSSSIQKNSSSSSSKAKSSSSVSSSGSIKSSSSISTSAGSVYDATNNTLKDLRDGQTYKTVTIGTQIWMAQNLNYEPASSSCYNDSAKYCAKYGRLYSWNSATTACPTGWRLPYRAEWIELFTAVGGPSMAGKMLKSTSDWNNSGNGTDAYAFSALPAGYRNYNFDFNFEGDEAMFWSSECFDNRAFYMNLRRGYDDAVLLDNLKYCRLSVRCLKD